MKATGGGGGAALAHNLLLLSFVFMVGVVGAVQTVINNRAGDHYGSFLIGTFIEFVGGIVMLLVMVGAEAWYKRLPFLRCPKWPRPWQCLGGVIGLVFVAATVGLTSTVGFGLFFIAVVVGQLSASAAMDHCALLGSTRRPLTPKLAVALAIAVGGALLSVSDRLDSGGGASSSTLAFLACLLAAAGAGVLMPVQTSINRGASGLLPSKLQMVLFSFGVGLACCTAAMAVQLAVQRDIAAAVPGNLLSGEWWIYTGGPGGVLYIASGIWLVQALGSAAFFVTLVCGQLAGSTALDAWGFLGTQVRPVTPVRVGGVALVVLAAVMMQLEVRPWLRRCGCCVRGSSGGATSGNGQPSETESLLRGAGGAKPSRQHVPLPLGAAAGGATTPGVELLVDHAATELPASGSSATALDVPATAAARSSHD